MKDIPGYEGFYTIDENGDCFIVAIMRQEYSLGTTQTSLAKTYGVDPSTVSRIVNKQNWNY